MNIFTATSGAKARTVYLVYDETKTWNSTGCGIASSAALKSLKLILLEGAKRLPIRTLIPGEIIAIDGKTLRRSHNRPKDLAALNLVSSWATAKRSAPPNAAAAGSRRAVIAPSAICPACRAACCERA
jgi:hypothetical protein